VVVQLHCRRLRGWLSCYGCGGSVVSVLGGGLCGDSVAGSSGGGSVIIYSVA
jgi:hypothetical protein